MAAEVIAWSFEQDIKPASTKYVLTALANYVQSNGDVWCAVSRLSKMTSLDDRTVTASLLRLEKLGYITRTGKLAGNTGRIPVYNIRLPDALILKSRNTPKNGVIKKSNTPNPAVKYPQFCTSNTPNIGGRSVIDPLLIQKRILNLRNAKKLGDL